MRDHHVYLVRVLFDLMDYVKVKSHAFDGDIFLIKRWNSGKILFYSRLNCYTLVASFLYELYVTSVSFSFLYFFLYTVLCSTLENEKYY